MGQFKRTETPIGGLVLLESAVFGDARGYFMETYAEKDFIALGISCRFVQDNHSRSNRGVLRGLHFQTCRSQAKLIRVIAGKVWDVAVDLRVGSPTFGQWFGVELSAENKLQLYIPRGFAHGFLTLENGTEFLYKCSDYYSPECEGGIPWNDPGVGIEWPFQHYGLGVKDLVLSEKDRSHPLLGTLNPETLFSGPDQ